MSVDDSDITASTSSVVPSIDNEDIKTTQEHEAVQNLEITKKLLEIEIHQLENEINNDSAESFSRDQLATVKSELEHNCTELFAQRTNSLLLKLEQARSEKQTLERRAANLKKTLQNEQRLTKQLAEERASQRPQRPTSFPELSLPDLSLLRESCSLAHRKRALEDEVREAERQLSIRRQAIAENEAKLVKIVQDSKNTIAECENQIRTETLDLAQLEEMRSSLKERIEANRQKQKQYETDKRILQAQIEAAEAAQRAKIDEINRNFLAAQREFEETRARKKAEIRKLTRELHENEELNRSKLAEKERLLQEINNLENKPPPPPKPIRKQHKEKKPRRKPQAQIAQTNPIILSSNIVQLQQEISDLQNTKIEISSKLEDLKRKASSNEKKLETVKSKLERKVRETENQLRRIRSMRDSENISPPNVISSDESYSSH